VDGPSRIAFTRHAELRADERGVSLQASADVVIEEHPRRRRNPGNADWIVRGRGIGIAYNWPEAGDATLALVVTLWRE
jgi:nitrous oxidase accessory protein NosD